MDWPPRLSLDNSLFKLLTGDRFYSDSDAALREAILNALDACHRRRFTDATLEPKIQITFDERTHCVAVADNGDGMSQAQISNLFSRIGATISRTSSESSNKIGEFGIGVASYFLPTDRFEVHTQSESGGPVSLEFHQGMLDGSATAKEVTPLRTEQGTTVYLYCRSKQLFELLLERYPYWVRDVSILVATRLPSGANEAPPVQ